MSDNDDDSYSDDKFSDYDNESENDKIINTLLKPKTIQNNDDEFELKSNSDLNSESNSDSNSDSKSFQDDEEDEYIQNAGDNDSQELNDEDSDIELDEDGEPIIKESEKTKTKTTKIINKPQFIIDDEDDYDDDDDDDFDENYLQKFDNEINNNYVNEYHPECLNNNSDEVNTLSVVVKNNDGIIIDPLHKTIPILTKYEKTRILGQRSKQIETGAKPFVKVPENIIDAYIIAELELKEKKIPFIIRRPIPGGGNEYWRLKDLEDIAF